MKRKKTKIHTVGTLPVYESMAQCHAATGIPITVLKAGKVKSQTSGSRLDLEKFLRWFFTPGKREDSTDWHTLGKKWTAELKRIEVEEKNKELIPFSLVNNFIGQLYGGMFADMERILKADFPSNMEGLSQLEIFKRGEVESERLKVKYEARLKKWLKENQLEDEE